MFRTKRARTIDIAMDSEKDESLGRVRVRVGCVINEHSKIMVIMYYDEKQVANWQMAYLVRVITRKLCLHEFKKSTSMLQ